MNTIELQLKIPMHGFFLNSTKLNLPAIRMMIGQSGWFLPILAWFLLTLCHVDADDCGCVDNATLEPASAGIVSGADDDDCPLVRVVSAQHATVIRARPQLKPGPLFYGSGSFAEKEVGEACDPGQSFGPFDVVAGGKLRARLSGEPAVQQRWSLFNRGTGVRITFEPNLGAGNYGPAQEVVVFYIPADETNAEMEGTWSGPGRLTAVTSAPAGAGPLSGSCFEQSYNLAVDVVEAAESETLQPGMTLQHGDRIVSDEYWGKVVLDGSNIFIHGGDVEFHQGLTTLIREGTFDIVRGRPPGYGDVAPDKVAERLARFREAGLLLPNNPRLSDYSPETLGIAWQRIATIDDPCRAALELKLYLDANQFERGPEHLVPIVADVAATWILPNNWDVIEGWGNWAFGKIPLVGYASTAQNVLDSWERVKKELTPTIMTQQGVWTLAAFDRFKAAGWSLAQIEAEERRLHAESQKLLLNIEGLGRELELKKPMMEAALEERIRQIQRAEDEQLSQLDEVIARKQRADESTVLEEAQRLAILGSTNAKINAEELKHVLQIRRLANDYSEAVGQKLTEVARLQAERTALSTYARPIAAGDCAGIKPLNPPREASPCLGVKAIEVTVKRGIMHVVEQRFEGMFDEQLTRTVITNLNLQQSLHKIIPDGTEYSVEHRGTSAIVRVHDGKVRVSAEGQDEVTVAAGQQISLPDSTVSPLTETSFGRVIGLPVAELPLNSQMAEAYGEQSLVADGETLPQGWLWQDTDPYMSGPGEAKLEFVAADTLRVTVPTENEFYRQRFDAPRLLRKVSGDFDLEADMNLESRGGNHAFSQFVIFSPDTPIGYLAGDMNPGGLDAHYLVLGGGRGLWMNVNKLQVFGRQWTDCDDAPQGAVRVKLTRRGDHWKTYFSTDEGQTWTLSSRHVLTMPETIWAGWVFRRMAHDGLADEPAVTTLKDVQLNSAPLHSLGEPNWDVVRFAGSTVVPSTKQVLLAQDGTDAHPARAYSTREISGDFDLVARYESLSMVLQQGQRRWIQLAVSSRDEKNIAFVRHDLTAEAERLESDIYINEGGGRYRHVDIQNAGTGRMRIRRQGGVLSTFVWQRDDWMRLGDWSQGFDDPVYIDLRFQWISPVAAPQAASFYLERLETEAGLLIGNHVDNEIAKAPPASTDVAPKPLAEKDASAGMSYRHPAGLLTIPLPAEWAIHYGLRGRQRDADFDTLADQRQERLIIFWRGSEPAPDPIAALDKFRSDVQAATSTIRDIQSKGYSLRGVPIVEVVYVQPESGNLICRFAAIAGGQRVHFDMVSRTVPERLMLPQDLQAILTTIEFAQVSAVVPQEPTKPEEPADIVLAERPPQTQARTMIRRQLDGRPRVVGINAVSAGTPAAAALGIESPLGAVIARVYPDTPAALAGLRAGDLIVQFGERTIENLEDLEATILSAPVNSRHNVTYVRGMRRLETEIYVARGDDSRPILGRFNHVTGDFHLDVLPAWIIQPDLNRDSVTRRLFHRIESGDKNYVIHIFRDSPPARDVDASLNEFVSKMRPEFASSHSGALQIGNHPGVFVSGPAELDGRRCTLYRIAFVINQRRHQIDIFAPPLSEPAELPFVAQVILGSLAD